MFNKVAIIALVSAVAAPALADGISGGHRMQAELLGLDPSQFTVNELAVIDANAKDEKDFGRASFIASQKAMGADDAVASDAYNVYVPRGRDGA